MIEITWLGHGTFQIQLENGETTLIDPWTEGNPKFPSGFQFSRVDHILLTHAHFDHVNGVFDLAKRFSPQIFANHEIATWLTMKGVTNATGMNKGGTIHAGSLAATMTHALHSSSFQEGDQIIYGGEAGGYVLTFPDGRCAYFAGDTAVFKDMEIIAELYRPELAFLPIGDLYTMCPKQAALACRMIRPKKVIPMHFGTFPPLTGTPAKLAELIRDLKGTEVWPLEPGVPVKW